MFRKSLLAAVAALTFAVSFGSTAQALHLHEKVVCRHVHHNGHIHQVCKVVVVPHVPIFGGHHHHHHTTVITIITTITIDRASGRGSGAAPLFPCREAATQAMLWR